MLSPMGGTMDMDAIMSRPVRMDREAMIREHLKQAGLGKGKKKAKAKEKKKAKKGGI